MRSVAISLVLMLTACGSVGEPLPPLLNIPGRVDDFRVSQQASELTAAWTWPVLGSEGQVFRDLERFEIYSVFVPPGGETPSVDAMSEHGELVSAVATRDVDAASPGSRLEIRAALAAQYGSKRGFAVRGVSSKGRASSWSDVRVLDIVQPPAIPSDLTVAVLEQGVKLAWNPVEGSIRYDIERRGGQGEFVLIGSADEPEYLDSSPQWDAENGYRVTAWKPTGGSPEVPGPPSTVAVITPRDTFPPAAPADLRALAVEEGVELSWSSNSEPDLAGYRVSRDGTPIHEGLLESANFSDQPLAAGQTAVYQVTAVDRDGNAGSPAEVRAVSPR